VVVPVLALEPVTGRWRSRWDPSAAQGMPSHITVLFPFLHATRLDAGIVEELRALCRRREPFDVEFAACGRFPDVLYLAPEPLEPFRALTAQLCDRWPEAPPYGGAYPEVVPHLTVAQGADETTFARIAGVLTPLLPAFARMEEAWLVEFDGQRWRRRERLPFMGL